MSVNSRHTPYRPAAVATGVCRSGSARPKAGTKGRRPVRRDTDPAPRTLFRKPSLKRPQGGACRGATGISPGLSAGFHTLRRSFLQFYNAKFCALVFFHATNLHLPSETPILPRSGTKSLPEGGVWGGVGLANDAAGGENAIRQRDMMHHGHRVSFICQYPEPRNPACRRWRSGRRSSSPGRWSPGTRRAADPSSGTSCGRGTCRPGSR